MTMSIATSVSTHADAVRAAAPLVHCITNYVTVESCANAVLAIGASPIMSDEPEDVRDITSICGALVLNIGTLNKQTIAGMKEAGAAAAQLGHPIVLDPVGAGASKLRTATACELLDTLPVSIVRGNMSEIKALAGNAAATQGVDVNPSDAVTDEEGIAAAAAFARAFAAKAHCVVAITGPIDIIADERRAFAVRNGSALQGRITGSGCMLSALCGAYAACAGERDMLESALAAVVHMGAAGQAAASRLLKTEGTGTFHRYVMDALSLLSGTDLAQMADVTEVAL
ncbi:MAG: hydroxyethylthiazole kinase [Slackia sp.]|nr:hydroxyethylthiazole kinase [Slackia sp.]